MSKLLRAVLDQVEASQGLSVIMEEELRKAHGARPMTPSAFLDHLAALGVRLTPHPDGTLRCRAPKGVLTPELQAQMAHYKADLLALLRPEWPGAAGCTRVGGHNFIPHRDPFTRDVAEHRCCVCNVKNEGGDAL